MLPFQQLFQLLPAPVPHFECIKAHTRKAPVRVPAQSAEPDAGINLAKKPEMYLQKKPAGLF